MAKEKQDDLEALVGGLDKIGTPDIEGFWVCEIGNPLVGRIRGWFSIFDRKTDRYRDVIVVETARECRVTVNKEPRLAPKGSIVGLGVRYKLRDLMGYVDSEAAISVNPTGKKDIGGGQSMWIFDMRAKGTKGPPPVGSAAAGGPERSGAPGDSRSESEGIDLDDIPF